LECEEWKQQNKKRQSNLNLKGGASPH
jgi:hypothetical protein